MLTETPPPTKTDAHLLSQTVSVTPKKTDSKLVTTPTRIPTKSIEVTTEGGTNVMMANPAAIYCEKVMEYEYEITEGESGQTGICTFPNGETCSAWAFLQGKCGQDHSYCAQQGYQIKTVQGGKDPFSSEYAICLSSDGELIGVVSKISGLVEIIQGQGSDSD